MTQLRNLDLSDIVIYGLIVAMIIFLGLGIIAGINSCGKDATENNQKQTDEVILPPNWWPGGGIYSPPPPPVYP